MVQSNPEKANLSLEGEQEHHSSRVPWEMGEKHHVILQGLKESSFDHLHNSYFCTLLLYLRRHKTNNILCTINHTMCDSNDTIAYSVINYFIP